MESTGNKNQSSQVSSSEPLKSQALDMTMPSPPVVSPTALSPPPVDENRKSIVFAKAAFAFRDNLGASRERKQQEALKSTPTVQVRQVTSAVSPTSTTDAGRHDNLETDNDHNEDSEVSDSKKRATDRISRQVTLLRLTQSTITASLSLMVAFFQGRVYITFQQTKSVSGAWPENPTLFATLLLFAMAIAALVFDGSMFVVYCSKGNGRRASMWRKRAFTLAMKAHGAAAAAKTMGWALAAAVCRSGFDFGNSSGQNNDLWSWTCSGKSAAETNITSAASNCQTQVRRILLFY
jgi:hypothetical protein